MKVIIATFFALCIATVSSELHIETKTYNEFPNKCNDVNMNPFFRIGKNYYFVQAAQKMSWFAAAHYCRNINSDLATIKSKEEMDAIQNYLISKGFVYGDHFWFAGNDLTDVFVFQWISNGQPMTYTKWSPRQPDNGGGNERCVLIWRKGREFEMNDGPCTDKNYFICQANTPKTVAVTVR